MAKGRPRWATSWTGRRASACKGRGGSVRAGRSLRDAGLVLVALLGLVPTLPSAAQERVDLALVLAVDASRSVDHGEFRLQMIGLANAFRDPSVQAAIRTGAPRGLALSLMQWSGIDEQAQVIPWTLLVSEDDMEAMADRISAAPRIVRGSRTALGEAMAASLSLFQRLGPELGRDAERYVVDISGDGGSNEGMLPSDARELARQAGVTVNGVAILNEEPRLDLYYISDVIVGAGAFLLTATDYVDFARAIRLKLIREIRGVPIAMSADILD